MSTNALRLTAVSRNLLLGGSTTFLLNFLRALSGRPERLAIVSAERENEHAADFAALGVEVSPGAPPELIYEDRLAWTYRALAATRPHGVLACLGAESFEMLRLAPPGVARVGIIQSHDPLPYEMARRYHASIDAMVGVSPPICEHLRGMPEFASKRVEEIPYGIHFAEASPRGAARLPLRVLYLGRLIEIQKRVSRLVELIRRCEGMPLEFTLAGSGPQEAELKEALGGVANVSFTGAVPNAKVAEVLRAHDLFVLLSDYEGLPLSLLEAMGEGLVPLVSDLPGGMGALVTPEAGFRVPAGDVAAAAAILGELAREPHRLAPFALAARERARGQYAAERMAERYLALIRSLGRPELAPEWPPEVEIPAPFGVPGWQYRGLARAIRRAVKKVFPNG